MISVQARQHTDDSAGHDRRLGRVLVSGGQRSRPRHQYVLHRHRTAARCVNGSIYSLGGITGYAYAVVS